MIKIALLGDIHGNLPALEAVLNHAKAHGVDNFLNVGNSLGFDIFPDETIQRLQIENVISILGRFDQRVLKAKAKLEKLKKSPAPDQWLFLNSFLFDSEQGRVL
jgi:predicted phosphodiesterase